MLGAASHNLKGQLTVFQLSVVLYRCSYLVSTIDLVQSVQAGILMMSTELWLLNNETIVVLDIGDVISETFIKNSC